MSSAAFLIAVENDRWSVARAAGEAVEIRHVPADGDPPPAGQAAAALAELGYAGQGVCLGLPAERVFAAQIDCGNLPRKDRRLAMLYRLEEQLPLEAERLTACFLPPVAGRAMGLAVETQHVQAIIDALAEAGVEVAAVCPTAMLALWRLGRDGPETAAYTLLADPAGVEVFRMGRDQPAAWYSLPPHAAELAECVAADMLVAPAKTDRPTADVIGPLEPDVVKALEDRAGVTVRPRGEQSISAAAAMAAGEVLAGRHAAWADFRRDDLAAPDPWQPLAGLLRAAAILGLALLVLLAGLLYWRSRQYDGRARRWEQAQADAYIRLYPGRRAPVNVRSALDSELRRLAGMRGLDADVPPQPSALGTLRQVVAALPPSLRLRILEVRIAPTGVLVEGQVRDHTAAEVVSQSLRRAGLVVEPPRTEHLSSGGVGFTLVAKPAAGEQLAVAKETRP